MKLFLFALCSFISLSANATNKFFVQPRIGYQAPKSFQASQVASYPGMSYSGAIYYKMTFFEGEDSAFDDSPKVSLAPMVSYSYGNFSNSANTALIQEKISDRTIAAGAKLYYDHVFLQAHYLWTSIQNTASSGASGLAISDSATGLGAALGIEIPITSYVSLELSGEVNNVNFHAKTGGYSSETQYLKFGGMVGLSILIPSGDNRSLRGKKAVKNST